MKLFDYIPQNFFSILSSKNKDIYAIALIVLHKSLQTEEMSIKKEDYIRVLKEKANDIINNLDVDSEEEVDEFDNTYGGCSIDDLDEILYDYYNVQVWDNFGSDVVSLCNKFGLGIADFDSNPGNLGFEYEGEARIKRIRFVDYGFKIHGGKDDRWNPLISELISA